MMYVFDMYPPITELLSFILDMKSDTMYVF